MSGDRKEKIAAAVERLAAEYLVENIGVPGAVVSVTRVDVSPDLADIKIYFSIFPESLRIQAMRQITASKTDMKAEIVRRLPIKFAPKIAVLPDTNAEAIRRAEEALENLSE